ncbi:MAG: YoaK family protein [Methylocella sp.]
MVSAEAEGPTARGMPPPFDNSRAVQSLLIVLSVTAGCTDVIGFLVLNGLFTAHITGNLVILAAHIVGGGEAQIAPMLSVPVFIVMVGLTRLLAGGLESIGFASLRPLLLLQFLLLAGFLVLCVAAGPRIDPNATNAILAGMLGVSAMAVQNALVQISLKGAPSTAVMTSNVTRFAIDIGEVLLGGDPTDVAKARNGAARTLPAIVGFTVGCGLGAACEAALGTWSLALPAGLALLAFAMGFAAEADDGPR